MSATKTIRQAVVIPASPKQVYDALIDSKKHARFTGSKAKIQRRVGGRFSCYDGYITGIHLVLDPGKAIVQAWRSSGWPNGYYSIVAFRLATAGRGKTRLTFTQLGVPANDYKAKSNGWRTHYWTPLKATFRR